MIRKLLLAHFLLVILASLAAAAPADWAGSEVTENGKRIIKNPATPMHSPSNLRLEEQWRVGGEDEDEEVFFGVLTAIDTDESGNIYLLDTQLSEVFVFSPHGDYLHSIGRQGEGPGEFRRASEMFVTTGGQIAVVQAMPGKIVMLTPEGDPAGNHPVQTDDDGVAFFRSAGRTSDGIVIQRQQFARRDNGFDITSALIRIDADGKKTAQYHEVSESRDFASMGFEEKTMSGLMRWKAGMDGRVYLSNSFDDYAIEVFNADGTPDRVIEREYQPRVRSAEEKEDRVPKIRFRAGSHGREVEVKGSDTDRAVLAMFPRADGSLWVMSSRGGFDTSEGTLGTFDVFDAEGRFVQAITLTGEGSFAADGFHFVGDRLFVVIGFRSAQEAMRGGDEDAEYDEDEDAVPMGVICYELGQFAQGRN